MAPVNHNHEARMATIEWLADHQEARIANSKEKRMTLGIFIGIFLGSAYTIFAASDVGLGWAALGLFIASTIGIAVSL